MRTAKAFVAALSLSVALAFAGAPVVSRAADLDGVDEPAAAVAFADSPASAVAGSVGMGDEHGASPDEVEREETAAMPEGVDVPISAEAIGEEAPADGLVAQAAVPKLSVVAHVQRYGWRPTASSGAIAGTTGENLRLEAVRMTVSGTGIPAGSIQYRVHAQHDGWQGWKSDGELAGTMGKGLRIEALRVRLTDGLAARHDVWYQVHVQDLGWMAPTSNGAAAGTVGCGLKVEALRVWIVEKGAGAPSDATVLTNVAGAGTEGLQLRAHVQDIGWQLPVNEGEAAGTVGRRLRIEALSVSVANLEVAGAVEYRAHVQDEGWQGWRRNGEVAGSTGRQRRVEAVQMRLTGELANRYDLYYRAHLQNVGWLAWAKGTAGGASAGSTGLGLRVEALQVRLVDKGAAAPSNSGAATTKAALGVAGVSYAAYVQTSGWLGQVSNGATAGSTGQSRRVEGFRASIVPSSESLPGGIRYCAHIQDVGWQDWHADDAFAGTTGQAKRVEAVAFELSGELAKTCSVWYRAYVQDVGWLGWAHDGEHAGTSGAEKRLEALEVRVLGAGVSAPGGTANHFLTAGYFQDAMTRKAQGYSSPTGQLVLTDLSAHRVGIYVGSQGNWTRTHLFPCSVGAPGSSTRRGVFSIGNRGYVFGNGFSCYYWTQFFGDYLFHSVLYYPGTFNVMDGRLGYDISHGCVRMAIDDARYINQNIRTGSTVVVY